jgi:serine protease Do
MDYNWNPNNYGLPPAKPEKKSKKGKVATVIASVLAVTVIGFSSGFGGYFLASRSGLAPSRTDDPPAHTTSTAPDETRDINEVLSELNIQTADTTLANTPSNPNGPYTAVELFKKVKDTIVIVNNYQIVSDYDFFGFRPSQSNNNEPVIYGTGSGIIITTDGYILTNSHVIDGALKVTVTIEKDDGSEEFEAKVVGSDYSTDLAVLKIETKETLQAATLGSSATLQIGQDVCAIGNPAGLNKTITKGIISGLNRYFSESAGYTLSSIQIDAAVNPGNSGGALLDMYGNVVGVVNSKIVAEYTENLGFAISIDEAKPIVSDLIQHGKVTGRPLLGITPVELDEYTAYRYGYNTPGILVKEIFSDAPVAQSGLKVGDLIIKLNGKTVTTVTDVQTQLKDKKAGDMVQVTVLRYSQHTNTFDELNIDIQLTQQD